MKFFDHQIRARRNTTTLIFLFGLAILALVLLTNLCVGLQIWHWNTAQIFSEEHLVTHFWISIGVVAFILGVSGFRYLVLSQRGGVSVALELGGRNIDPSTTDLDERRLLNIVEEMSIASGVPMPEVFVFEDQAINAFAVGLKREDAAIGVTAGTIKLLSRDELQGVVGHEFSHILNGDMRLNTMIHACLHGIMAISTIGRLLLRGSGRRDPSWGSGRRRRGGGLVLFGLGLFVIGSVGTFFGKLIQAAMSRQREYLADASAVQFTRNPDGLAGALKKIMGQTSRSFEGATWAAEFQHIFFSPTVTSGFFGLTATHPPLEERVRRIQNLPGNFPVKAERTEAMSQARLQSAGLDQLQSLSVSQLASPQDLLGLLAQTPRLALQEVYSVRAVIYALFLSDDPETFKNQEQMFSQRNQKPLFAMAQKVKMDVGVHREALRLPLIEIAMPTLRRMSEAQRQQFFVLLDDLVGADGDLAIYEYALIRILKTHLTGGAPKPPRKAPSKTEAQKAILQLLSGFVHMGGADEASRRALAAQFEQKLGSKVSDLMNWQAHQIRDLEGALDSLQGLPMNMKESLLGWISECILFDGQSHPRELEMLKAVALSLGAPIPRAMRASYLKVA